MTSSKRILIVEDSRTQAEHLRFLLEKENYHVEVATDGKKALAGLDQYQPELIISDVVMPEMSGYELCWKIREHIKYRDVPFVLLTTLSGTEDVIQGLECGASNFIIKPYEDAYLLKRVKTIFATKESNNHLQKAPPIYFSVGDKNYTITAERAHILNLLVSIYDTAVQRNQQLVDTQLQLQELNRGLETKVNDRTQALRAEMEERKHYEQQFLQAQKMESIGQIAGGIAHDFNNILMVIRGNLELLAMQFKSDTKEAKRITSAMEASDRGGALIKRLMGFARKQELQSTQIDMRQLIDSFSRLLKSVMTEAITVRTHLPDNTWPVYTDPNQLETALLNLAVNARDAMKEKGTLTIDVSHVVATEKRSHEKYKITPGEYVKITVSDTGEGIKPENYDRIFEPFFTTKDPGKGTGLGLSMVYGFVKQSQGHVTVESELGKGTQVSIYLPRSLEKKKESKMTSKETPQTQKATGKILLVEDEDSLRELATEFLMSLGYRVVNVADGVEALEVLKKETQIDLLFSDVVMPNGLSGIELAEQAKKMYPHLKVLLTSGYSRKGLDEEVSSKEIPYPVLSKPYRIAELAQVIHDVLNTPQ